ncbi:hypothetical protein EJ08DRAFT_589404 [Tothia fuscella]|uniref:Uncharacterized protein n=1 Tax=Tothia fuscella TaxID=1048955 RepID=A0A9P4NS09_9PEZI|nr:hypothetical protein EJ08DRAFT_589404 [Tothia fuscella]
MSSQTPNPPKNPTPTPNITPFPTLPRIAITFCTQCKWMLRAAYFAQELLSTFSTTIGEVALIPATGGIFTVVLTYESKVEIVSVKGVRTVLLWDRKSEGGFPETKILKQRVRNYLDPSKNLGHSDTPANNPTGKAVPSNPPGPTESGLKSTPEVPKSTTRTPAQKINPDGTICEDCN